MNQRARDLTEQIEQFNRAMIDCVQNCSDADWKKACAAEDWPVGVVARHVGHGHLSIIEMATMIIKGDPLPELTMETVIQMGNDHAREHADCTRTEVLAIFEENGKAVCDFVVRLSDEELDRTGHMALVGGEISTQQIMELVILQSGGEHLASIKTAIAG